MLTGNAFGLLTFFSEGLEGELNYFSQDTVRSRLREVKGQGHFAILLAQKEQNLLFMTFLS